jgi:hypothetical protein
MPSGTVFQQPVKVWIDQQGPIRRMFFAEFVVKAPDESNVIT